MMLKKVRCEMTIKKGDRVVVQVGGVNVEAIAASNEKDGTLQIKYKGTFSTVIL